MKGRLQAILGQCCPRCYRGQVFRGPFAMNERCPVCGLEFGREPGYFTGAMYVSYLLAVLVLGAIAGPLLLWSGWPLEWVLLAAGLGLLPFVPAIFRYSRVIWMHFDRAIDPDN